MMLIYSFLITLIISLVLMLIYMLTSFNSPLNFYEKKTPFECGFDPISIMRSSMSTRFFLLLVLFLIFDIEISLLFPFFNIMIMMNNILIMISIFLFLLLLFLGLLMEWSQGALEWM
uniref:NADH dehydrogenase subunit 3 n=1 Tax=Succinea arundinetorum TaxID=2981998 RepID=UPI00226D3BA6|nr:NADH dehydrogenase subunit 3 [Succinea arundinetorum]UZH97774.1 NADH dehydrogenase subunit 3 [Succinea arundinetorum]